MKRILSSLFIFFGLIFFLPALAAMEAPNQTIIYFFYGEGCPHCAAEEPFLDGMEEKYPNLVVKRYEVWKNQENQKLFQEFIAAYNVGRSGVPQTYIGTAAPTIGYGTYETTGVQLEEKIKNCLNNGCADPLSKVHPEQIQTEEEAAIAVKAEDDQTAEDQGKITQQNLAARNQVEIYLFTSTGCPHCASLEQYLNNLKSEIPELKINHYDLRKEPESIILCQQLASACSGNIDAVPMVFIGDEMIIGDRQNEIRQKIEFCLAAGCPSPIDRIELDNNGDLENAEEGKEAAGNNLALVVTVLILVLMGSGLLTFFIIKAKKGGQ